MNFRKILTYFISVVAAFCIGYFLPRPPNQQNTKKQDYDSTVGNMNTEMRKTEDSQQPENDLFEGKGEEEINPRHLLASDEYLRDFLLGKFKHAGGYVRLKAFDKNGNISAAFSEVYGLTDWEEQQLLNEAAKVREQHYQLAKANSEITAIDNGGTRVLLNLFLSSNDLYSDMLDSFQSIMGDERFANFLDLGEPEMRSQYYQFGAEKLVVDVIPQTQTVTGPDGQPIEVTKYEIVETKERAGQTSSRSLENIDGDYLESEFGLVKRLIDDKERSP